MVIRPVHLNAYEFVVVAALRTQQLLAGSAPRIAGQHRAATMAQWPEATLRGPTARPSGRHGNVAGSSSRTVSPASHTAAAVIPDERNSPRNSPSRKEGRR
jgi:hypothetical protein